MRLRDYEWKRCENCEGEGRVVAWLSMGHEVPASRKERYPDEAPEDSTLDTRERKCPECRGTGKVREG